MLCPHEDGCFEERVQHEQLAYASYAALLAALEVPSLLGVGTRGEGKPRKCDCFKTASQFCSASDDSTTTDDLERQTTMPEAWNQEVRVF